MIYREDDDEDCGRFTIDSSSGVMLMRRSALPRIGELIWMRDPKWDTRRPLLGFDTNYFHIIAGCWGRIVTWDGLLSTHDRRHGPPVTILFLFEILFDTMELTREKVCFDLWFGSKYRISNINIPHILQTSKTKSIVRKIVKFQCFLAKNFEIFPFCWNSAESQTIQKRKYGEIFIGDFSHRRQCKPTQL